MKRLKNSIVVIGVLSLTVFGQGSDREARRLAFIVPTDVALPVVVSQPECPLRFQDARLVGYVSGGAGTLYRLRNISKKAVASYTIATWHSDNTGSFFEWNQSGNSRPLQPGHYQRESTDLQVIRLTDKMKDSFRILPPMKHITFFMILEVKFVDGTGYNAKNTFAALQHHLEQFAPVYKSSKQKQ